MKPAVVTLAALCVWSATAAIEDPVPKLTYYDFDQKVLGSNEPWLLKFYAPWCGHCKAVASVVVEAAVLLQAVDNTPRVNVGKVNCVEQKVLCKRFKIDAFPGEP
jgi:thioredoxin-like negative regulator of GroEL